MENDDTSYSASGLTVYVPPQGRSLKTAGGRIWNSGDAGVVFFESIRYGDFTNAEWLGNLLAILMHTTSVRQVGIRVDPAPTTGIPDWLSNSRSFNNILIGQFRVDDSSKVMNFFDAEASYGVWDFYGLPPESRPASFRPLPEGLDEGPQYRFLVEVDLDSMLLGYADSKGHTQELAATLTQFRTRF